MSYPVSYPSSGTHLGILAEDLQETRAWEEVYGAAHPLTAGDVPVLDNAIARLFWRPATSSWVFESFVPALETMQELGSFTVHHLGPGVAGRFDLLDHAHVLEWTPERAVLQAELRSSAEPSAGVDVILTLQRGWTGPRLEAYPLTIGGAAAAVELRLTPSAAGEVTVTTSQVAVTSTGAWNEQDVGAPADFAGMDPWAAVLPAAPARPVLLAVTRQGHRRIGVNDTNAYGTTRRALAIRADGALAGYVSLRAGSCGRDELAAAAPRHGATSLVDVRALPELVPR